jgi:hypothetical protein
MPTPEATGGEQSASSKRSTGVQKIQTKPKTKPKNTNEEQTTSLYCSIADADDEQAGERCHWMQSELCSRAQV